MVGFKTISKKHFLEKNANIFVIREKDNRLACVALNKDGLRLLKSGPLFCCKKKKLAVSIPSIICMYRRDCVVIRASASQSGDLGFIPLFESYQKTLKNGIHSFPAWRSGFKEGRGEQAGKFACCVLGQGT